jgi:hypothetical protein
MLGDASPFSGQVYLTITNFGRAVLSRQDANQIRLTTDLGGYGVRWFAAGFQNDGRLTPCLARYSCTRVFAARSDRYRMRNGRALGQE